MLTVVIQAGGESQRMGHDKALMPFLGRPLIQRIVDRLAPIADELLVTTNHPNGYRFLDLPLFPDLKPGRGALGGLLTALSTAHQPLVAVVACDMPFVSQEILAQGRDVLTESGADVAIPQSAQGLEPLHAVYRRATCLPAVEVALDADQWKVISWFPQVQVRVLAPSETAEFNPHGLAFWNLNTPEEFLEGERLAKDLAT
jgi:molybdopterin-guanine dinucleotide biosynthesis protein A